MNSPEVRAATVVALLAAFAGCGEDRRDDAPRGGASAPGFRDVAEASGIEFRMHFLRGEQGENFKTNLYDHGAGVAVADVDGDGLEDLYFLNQLGPNALYRNRGDGTFEDVTERAGVGLGDAISVAGCFADTDRDGDQDLYVTTTRALGGNRYFRNEGGLRFTDATREAGLEMVAHSQSAAFFDFDGDGDADLFVTNTAEWTLDRFHEEGRYYEGRVSLGELLESPLEYNRLYRNEGDGTFTDVTGQAGVRGPGWGGDVAAFDYDEDGRLDVFVTNMFGRSVLYRNRGDGTFEDVTADVLGRTSWGTIGARPFDYDDDGRTDLFLTDMHSDMWMPTHYSPKAIRDQEKYEGFWGARPELIADLTPAERQAEFERWRLHPDEVVFGNTLFHALPGGRFEEVSDRAGMETFWPWGTAVGDFDLDGDQDVYLASGMGYPYFYWHSYLMMNQGDGTFADRSAEEGIDPPPGGRHLDEQIAGKPYPRSSRSVATLDFDGDGRLDLAVNNFNHRAYLFRNQFPERPWIAFRLRGTRSEPDAVGARVVVHAGGRRFHRSVPSACGYLSQSSRTLHFGLGGAERVERVEIRWPSGTTQTLEAPDPGRIHDVVEPGP